MAYKKLSKRDPHDPAVIERALERLRTMPLEELDALLSHRKEGVEITHMNEDLAEYYRQQRLKAEAEKAA